MTKTIRAAVILLAGFILIGCPATQSGSMYTRDQARQPLSIYYGTILEVKPATIEGTKSAVGPAMGAAAGAAVGNTIGHGTGRTLATVAGGILGTLAGGAAEEAATRKDALEITVELDDGQIMAVVQVADEAYRVGDRIRIIKSPDGTTRIRQ